MQGNHTTNDNDSKKRVALLARMGFVWQMAAWTDFLFGRVRGRNQSPASIFK